MEKNIKNSEKPKSTLLTTSADGSWFDAKTEVKSSNTVCQTCIRMHNVIALFKKARLS